MQRTAALAPGVDRAGFGLAPRLNVRFDGAARGAFATAAKVGEPPKVTVSPQCASLPIIQDASQSRPSALTIGLAPSKTQCEPVMEVRISALVRVVEAQKTD